MRRYFNNSATSFFRFATEEVLEGTPTRIGNSLSKMVILEHIGNPQVFHGNKGVNVDVMSGRLMGMVFPLAGDPEVLLRRLLGRFALTVGTLLPPGCLALRPTKFFLSALETTRILDRVSIGVRDKVFEANVQTNTGAGPLLGSVSEIANDEDVPMTVGPKNKVSGFGSPFKRAVLLDLKKTSELLRSPEPSSIRVKVHIPPKAVLPKLYRMPAVRAFEARKADLLSKLFTVKELLESFVQPVRKSLDRSLRNMFTTASLETGLEIVSVKKLTGFIVVSLDHFQHLIVEMAAPR